MPERGRPFIYESERWTVDLGRRELLARRVPVPLGGRAFEIIEVLVRSAGKLVTKDELMARVWPDTVVGDNTLQVHISAVRKALGSDRGLLRTVSGRGYRLLGNWTSRDAGERAAGERAAGELANVAETTPPPPSVLPLPAPPFQTNFPLAVSRLIGRTEAIRTLRDLISAYRVVTLTGPGGIGKTSLALELARDLFPGFQGDGWLIELASLSDPDLVCSTTAGVLGLGLGAQAVSPAAIARAIGARKLLLLLDNCEHVIDTAAKLAETIVGMCPGTTVLATSREALRIDSEVAFRVPPLEAPSADSPSTGPPLDGRPRDGGQTDDILSLSAMQLFGARLQALRFDFTPDQASVAAMAAICRQLDGIPLAIELAAACAATLGIEQVLTRLEDRFGLLTSAGRRTAPPRHQTLRATLDWSYELLPETERHLLRALGIFPASFTLEAAAAVENAPSGTAATVEGVARLVEKSLVALDGGSSTTRWRLLETTRAYALEKLAERAEVAQVARRHAMFYRDLLSPAGPGASASAAGSAPQPGIESLSRHVREIDNVRAALDWAFSAAGDAAIGIALTVAFVPVWLHMSLLVECRERVSNALAHLDAQPAPNPVLRMKLDVALGLALVYTTGLVARTEQVLAAGLALAEQIDDLDHQLVALWALWFYHMTSGELRQAEPLTARFVTVALRSADPSDRLLGDQIIGNTMHYKGNQQEARIHFDRVLEVPEELRDPRHSTWILGDVRVPARAMLARVLLLQGYLDRAGREARTSFDSEQARGRPLSICGVLRYAVCTVAFATGDLLTAEWSVAMLNALAEQHGSAFWSRIGRCLQGTLLIKRGDLAAGTPLLRDALQTVRNRPPDLLGVLAEGLAGIGEYAEALATIDERLRRSELTAEQWYDPELLRIKGELLLQSDEYRYAGAAATYFQDAIQLTRRQDAPFWELRAAHSLARLRLRQNQPGAARQPLAQAYARFTEGFEMADLCAAKALLDTLPQ